jgi:hypothetical protein
MIKNQEFINRPRSVMRKSGEISAPGDHSFNKNRFFHDAILNQPSYTLE